MTAGTRASGGIYVHLPFCRRKCGYCDFYSITDLTPLPDYVAALAREIGFFAHLPLVFDSLYIGGGTPSLLPPDVIARVMHAITQAIQLDPQAEITLEANPDSLDCSTAKAWRHIGINRLIVGIQSLNTADLLFLGRPYTADRARRSFFQARAAGFTNIGIDLMYGLPQQTPAGWQQTLQQALQLNPEHISCYALTIEPATPLGQACARKEFEPVSEARQAVLFTRTHQVLTAAGYDHYEVSNYARIGHPAEPGRHDSWRAQHNRRYWSRAPILGVGAAAHSYMPPVRFWNYRRIERYITQVRQGRLPQSGHETLTFEQDLLEMLFLGLRTSDGIDLADFEAISGRPFREQFGDLPSTLLDLNLIDLTPTHCRPTLKGMLYADGLARILAAEI